MISIKYEQEFIIVSTLSKLLARAGCAAAIRDDPALALEDKGVGAPEVEIPGLVVRLESLGLDDPVTSRPQSHDLEVVVVVASHAKVFVDYVRHRRVSADEIKDAFVPRGLHLDGVPVLVIVPWHLVCLDRGTTTVVYMFCGNVGGTRARHARQV
jgi:hypothetical protein